jgi:hypothetical protein
MPSACLIYRYRMLLWALVDDYYRADTIAHLRRFLGDLTAWRIRRCAEAMRFVCITILPRRRRRICLHSGPPTLALPRLKVITGLYSFRPIMQRVAHTSLLNIISLFARYQR